MILANEGQSGGISMNDEFEKFMETIVGKGIMKSFAKVNMKDYLTLFKNFDDKKYEVSESRSIVRIFLPETLNALINKKFRGGIPEALQRTIYRNSVTFKYHKLCISNSVFNTFFQNAINNISKFIEKILTKTDAKDIIIIGKFAESKLVKDFLQEKFKKYRIIIPPEAGFAALKGAVYFSHIQSQCAVRTTDTKSLV